MIKEIEERNYSILYSFTICTLDVSQHGMSWLSAGPGKLCAT